MLTIAAQLGAAARDDLQSLTAKHYGRGLALVLMVSVVVVNVVTIAADLQAGAAGLGLLAHVDPGWLVAPLGLMLGSLLVAGKFQHVAGVLRYLLTGFLAFAAVAGLARPQWPAVVRGSLVPAMPFRHDELSGGLALLGTTLTSYVYVWEAIARGVEEPPGPDVGPPARIRAGAIASAVFTALVLWCMIIASAATLGRHHHPATSAAGAAWALRPLAGPAAADLFGLGLVASALVALPVLMATTAYVVGAYFGWGRGLSEGIGAAPGFYAALAASTGLAVAVTLAHVPVVGMLVAASLADGLGTPIGLVLLVRLARDPEVMGSTPISRRLAAAGWAVALIVAGIGAAFILGAVLGGP